MDFPPTTPPSAAVIGETPTQPEEALKNYVRMPKKRYRPHSLTEKHVPKEKEDTTLRDVAIGVTVGSALSHVSHHSDDSYSSSSDSSSSSSDSFSSGGGSFGGGGSSDSFD